MVHTSREAVQREGKREVEGGGSYVGTRTLTSVRGKSLELQSSSASGITSHIISHQNGEPSNEESQPSLQHDATKAILQIQTMAQGQVHKECSSRLYGKWKENVTQKSPTRSETSACQNTRKGR
jgi:hypothetical protein